VVSFTPRPLYLLGKSPLYPLDRILNGPQCRSGRRGQEKIIDPTGTRNSIPWTSSPYPLDIPTTLCKLLVANSNLLGLALHTVLTERLPKMFRIQNIVRVRPIGRFRKLVPNLLVTERAVVRNHGKKREK
jgi:hypothetical protein